MAGVIAVVGDAGGHKHEKVARRIHSPARAARLRASGRRGDASVLWCALTTALLLVVCVDGGVVRLHRRGEQVSVDPLTGKRVATRALKDVALAKVVGGGGWVVVVVVAVSYTHLTLPTSDLV